MAGSMPVEGPMEPGEPRRPGPGVTEPPALMDPRRWGGVVGLVGGMVFITSYSAPLGTVVSLLAWVLGSTLTLTAVVLLFIRPVELGPLVRPRPVAVLVYLACVAGEVVLIGLGSRALTDAGASELRPALIAAVVGVHFLPFAWAFGERMFYLLGSVVAVLGAAGLVVGALGVARAAEVSAVLVGLAMLGIIVLYARGRFAPT